MSERKPNKKCEYKVLVPNYGSEDLKLSAISIQLSATKTRIHHFLLNAECCLLSQVSNHQMRLFSIT